MSGAYAWVRVDRKLADLSLLALSMASGIWAVG